MRPKSLKVSCARENRRKVSRERRTVSRERMMVFCFFFSLYKLIYYIIYYNTFKIIYLFIICSQHL